MTFGQLIAEARKKLGISQKELAAKIKKEDGDAISAQYLNDIEHDRRNPPSEFLMAQLAKELKLSLEYLMFAAGSFPDEYRSRSGVPPERVEKAFHAFRKTLRGGS